VTSSGVETGRFACITIGVIDCVVWYWDVGFRQNSNDFRKLYCTFPEIATW